MINSRIEEDFHAPPQNARAREIEAGLIENGFVVVEKDPIFITCMGDGMRIERLIL